MNSPRTGTMISLERAVALGKTWGYLASAAAGTGGLAIIAGARGTSARRSSAAAASS